MGKLGKKARKFAKKNLQSVYKKQRKLKSMFKKRASSKNGSDPVDDHEEDAVVLPNARKQANEDVEDICLDSIFGEDDVDEFEDGSESDGYLSEDSSCTLVGKLENGNLLEEKSDGGALSVQNKEIHVELLKQTKRLDKLKEKDLEFSKFLENYDKGLKASNNEESCSDEDEIGDDGDEEASNLKNGKLMTAATVSALCELVTEKPNVPALINLLNGYRAACHHGTGSTDILGADFSCKIENGTTFSKILMFVLHEADSLFRDLLGIPSSNCRKDAILEMKNNVKWKNLRALVKSYVRSTLFLLSQVTDSDILSFALSRIRVSLIFFAAFPPLLRRLIKVSVHLWATGRGILSSHSFLVMRDVAAMYGSDCFDACLVKAYKAFIGHCKFVEAGLFEHVQFLRNSFVELCSLDVQKSACKSMVSVQLLAKIMQKGLLTKMKEPVKKIGSWQYTNCLDLWVTFVSANIHDCDLQPLLLMLIQIVNGVAHLFPGPRYLPLRVKCVQWLNNLSRSSGIFIPAASLALDLIEYKTSKEGGKSIKDVSLSSDVKLPKYLLKSRNFQEASLLSTIELLSAHFSHWSYHITFPELATIPLIRLKKFHEITPDESFRRVVKRFIDQVEKNVEYVQKKRDEVAFSPKDQQAVDAFCQHEKSGGNASFTQYYNSMITKAASRTRLLNEKLSSVSNKKKQKIRDVLVDGNKEEEGTDKKRAILSDNGGSGKVKKRKVASTASLQQSGSGLII